MRKYEYLSTRLGYPGDSTPPVTDHGSMIVWLDWMDKNGWEFITNERDYWIFRRPVESPPPDQIEGSTFDIQTSSRPVRLLTDKEKDEISHTEIYSFKYNNAKYGIAFQISTDQNKEPAAIKILDDAFDYVANKAIENQKASE